MSIRFLAAGLLLSLFLIIKKGWDALRVPLREILTAMLMGAALLGFGIGNVSLAEHYIPSGIVALIISAMPFWIAIFRALSGDRPTSLSWVGVFVGLVGVGLLLRPGQVHAVHPISHSGLFFWMAMVLIGNITWAFGTFISPKVPLPKSALVLTSYEMLGGGISLGAAAIIHGDKLSALSRVSAGSWWALLYLILIGSIVAYSAYLWLVGNAPVSLTATYAYVNPVIAVFLGATFLHEKVSLTEAIGGAIVILGVVLVVSAESRNRKIEIGVERVK